MAPLTRSSGPISICPISFPAIAGRQLQQAEMSVPAYSTLQPLRYPYVVPGGRFREVYYWDSYFTMLGLEGDGQHQLAVDLLKNFAFEIDRYGMISNGN